MIGKYELKARVYPTIIALLPIMLLGLYFSIDYKNLYSFLGGLGLTTVLTFLLGQLGRDRGKKFEQRLWDEWGGTPSTQVLRYSDATLSKHIKKDIHASMANATGIGSQNMKEIEKKNPRKADDIYASWCDRLRSLTRDTTKYRLLFSENINYGFRRNLWGLKGPALLLIILVVLGIVAMEYDPVFATLNLTDAAGISLLLLALLMVFWLFVVRKSWIRSVAFAYAKSLVETYTTL